ncbi:MAG: hypothetical protein K9M00_03005, partial [Candidatus Omnitrophica bacterium]|nr:hypothetical protein [Candidatus Omnitrophota bacterium]
MIAIIFYTLIVITGFLTISTDILRKKIKNKHLVFIAAIAIFLYIFFGIKGDFKISLPLIINPVIALMISLLLYFCDMWKAGDAKLFVVYSLLVYKNNYSATLPLSCFVIFVNTFLISFICLIPYIIKNIIDNKNKMRKKILSKDTLKYLLKIILIAFSISWLIKPVLRLLPFKNIFFLEFTFIYLGYLFIYKYIDKIKSKKTLLILIFAIGLITRYILMPESFQLVNISAYLRRIFQFSLLIYIIRAVMNIEEKKSA